MHLCRKPSERDDFPVDEVWAGLTREETPEKLLFIQLIMLPGVLAPPSCSP